MTTIAMSMPDHKHLGILARLVGFLRGGSLAEKACAHAEGWVTWPYDGRLQFCPACGKLDDKPRMAA